MKSTGVGTITDLSRLYRGSSMNKTCGLITSSLAMLTRLLSPVGSLFIKQCPPMSLSAQSPSDMAAIASSTMDFLEDRKAGSWSSAEKYSISRTVRQSIRTSSRATKPYNKRSNSSHERDRLVDKMKELCHSSV
jgi:hypothetical protein